MGLLQFTLINRWAMLLNSPTSFLVNRFNMVERIQVMAVLFRVNTDPSLTTVIFYNQQQALLMLFCSPCNPAFKPIYRLVLSLSIFSIRSLSQSITSSRESVVPQIITSLNISDKIVASYAKAIPQPKADHLPTTGQEQCRCKDYPKTREINPSIAQISRKQKGAASKRLRQLGNSGSSKSLTRFKMHKTHKAQSCPLGLLISTMVKKKQRFINWFRRRQQMGSKLCKSPVAAFLSGIQLIFLSRTGSLSTCSHLLSSSRIRQQSRLAQYSQYPKQQAVKAIPVNKPNLPASES